MFRSLIFLLFVFLISCSNKKEQKFTIIKDYETTTWILLKERISKEEVKEIANEFITKQENKKKKSICFFLSTRKHETAFAIVYFLNLKINKTVYNFNEKKYSNFFNLKFKENIINHWKLKYSSSPFQVFIFEKDNQLFYKSLTIDFYSNKLYYEYLEPLINIDTLKNNEIKFQLKNNDSLRYYLIDKDKNLKTFYKNKLNSILYYDERVNH